MRPLVPSAPLSFTLEAFKIIVTTHTPPLVPPGGTPPSQPLFWEKIRILSSWLYFLTYYFSLIT